MKREIKFRAYIGNKFIYSNDLQEFAKIKQFKNEGLRMVVNRPKLSADCIEGGNNISNHGQYYSEWYDLQQYTGMKDKDGKDIYEGDIVKSTKYIGGNFVENTYKTFTVIFDLFCFQFKPIIPAMYTVSLVGHEQLEVIGNIYENANLLTQ